MSKEITNLWISNFVGQNLNGNYVIENTFKNGFVFKYNNVNIYTFTENKIYSRGDLVSLQGIIKKLENSNSFYKSNNIYLVLQKPFIEIVEKNLLVQKFDNYNLNAKIFLNLILLSTKISSSKEILKTLQNLNLSHFFVVSGFHFAILFLTINLIISKIKYISKFSIFISFIILFCYLILLKFQISAFRAFIFLALVYFNKKYLNSKFKNVDILAFLAYCFILFNPSIIYNLSFIFSFTLSTIILLSNNIFKFVKRKWLTQIFIVILAFISSQLISITINSTISIFGFLYQMIFTPIFYLSYLISIIFFWQIDMCNAYFNFLNEIIIFLDKTNYLVEIKKQAYSLIFALHLMFIFLSIIIEQKRIYTNFVIKNHFLKCHQMFVH